MIASEKSASTAKRPIILSPWLVVLGALILYGGTMDHWVSFTSLPTMARITGWDWHPGPLEWRQFQPNSLLLVLTSPIRIMPASIQPLLLNIFTVLCAAGSLGLLAASVRLLPHDRTKEQRLREGGEFALLSVRMAFLPALFAVLVLAFHIGFWRHAISTTGEMLDLLVFATLIFSILKYRVTQNDNWLFAFAFIYGLGITENWGLIGYIPLFLLTLIWIRGLTFFNIRFLIKLALSGFAGLLLYLVTPAISSLGPDHANFFSVLHMELGAESFGLRGIPKWVVAVAGLPTLLPLFFAGIKWPSFEGELSAAGNSLTKLMFRLLHVVFLLLALVLFFEFKFSPNARLQEEPISFLTMFYAGALCVGYFSGYILLVYSKGSLQPWERRKTWLLWLNHGITGLLWLLVVVAPCGLLYQNFPRIQAHLHYALKTYADEVLRELPQTRSVILSDEPSQLYLINAAFARTGRTNGNIMIDTESFPHREFIFDMLRRHPELKGMTVGADKIAPLMIPQALTIYLGGLAKSNHLYYLHPSFGYFFEGFYLTPHGLIFEPTLYPSNQLTPPVVNEAMINENNSVWANAKSTLELLAPKVKLDPDAEIMARIYSTDANNWGVSLQRADKLKEANGMFVKAISLNPENALAGINKAYNEKLQRNDHTQFESSDLLFKGIRRYRDATTMLKYCGPVDEPGMCADYGQLMAQGHDFRQAAILFKRRLELIPDDPRAELDLAKTFVDWGFPRKALDWVATLRAQGKADPWEISRVEALAHYGMNDFPTAERILQNGVKEKPLDLSRIWVLAEFYRVCAYEAMRQKTPQTEEANRRFDMALRYIKEGLDVISRPGATGDAHYNETDFLLREAEVYTMLKQYNNSISTLNRILTVQPENSVALLNRAIAEIQINQIQQARDDYMALRKLMPKQTYVVDFGLADIAHRSNDAKEEVHQLKRYLHDAPTETPEYMQVQERLKKLETGAK